MKFKLFVRSVTVIVEIILTLIILIMFTAFAIKPTELTLFTNSLILVMIMVQLYTVNVLIDVGDQIEKVKKR
jgi:antibiotic biosynthesis monooxygenase (ABM) superfamily enzyme